MSRSCHWQLFPYWHGTEHLLHGLPPFNLEVAPLVSTLSQSFPVVKFCTFTVCLLGITSDPLVKRLKTKACQLFDEDKNPMHSGTLPLLKMSR